MPYQYLLHYPVSCWHSPCRPTLSAHIKTVGGETSTHRLFFMEVAVKHSVGTVVGHPFFIWPIIFKQIRNLRTQLLGLDVFSPINTSLGEGNGPSTTQHLTKASPLTLTGGNLFTVACRVLLCLSRFLKRLSMTLVGHLFWSRFKLLSCPFAVNRT